MMKRVFQFLLIMVFSSQLYAQESCTEKLYKANNLYEKGQITDAIDIANSCATKTNSKSDKWQAYRLLALSYLVTNQTTEARKTADKMLDLNPTYNPSYLKDPIELINLLKSVKIIPKFSIGTSATIGLNFTNPRITTTFNGANYTNPKTYTSQNYWQAGIIMGYNFNENFSLHSGLMATSKNYNIKYKHFYDIIINERLSYLETPLFVRGTSQSVKGFRFFADAGAFVGRLVSAQSDFKSVVDKDETNSAQNINSESRRMNWEYGILGGVGTSYSFSKFSMALDCRYYRSLSNITNTDNRYNNDKLFYNYFYIDDDLKLDNIAISLGLIYYVNYKVIKKSDKR